MPGLTRSQLRAKSATSKPSAAAGGADKKKSQATTNKKEEAKATAKSGAKTARVKQE